MRKFFTTLLLASGACFATNTVNISFTGLPAVQDFGTYNGFSTATVGSQTNVLVICDDAADRTNIPSGPWVYDYSTINTSSSTIPGVKFTPSTTSGQASFGLTQTQMYEEAALIVYALAGISPIQANAEIISQYQYALWNLMDNNAYAGTTTDINAEKSIQSTDRAAVLAPTSQDRTIFSELVIYTPANVQTPYGNSSQQEFLRLAPVPEPPTFEAAALALFGIAFVLRRRRMHVNA